jgi:hypothetical protein
VYGGDAREVELSRLLSHDCPLFSRDDSVSARPVCTSHEESLCICESRDDDLGCVGLNTPPKPCDDSAPDGAELSSGSTMETLLFTFRFSRVLLEARERAGELLNIPLGEGTAEMWLIEAGVCRSEVSGSK